MCASMCAHTPVSRGLPSVPKEHICEIWGQRDHLGLGALAGGLGQAEAKDPINSCDPLGTGEGVFFLSEERSEGNSQFGIVLEKNMNYLSVTSRPAWRGRAWRGAEAQTARRGSKSGQHPRSRTPRAVSRRAARPSPSCTVSLSAPSPGRERSLWGVCSQRAKVPKISLSMSVPPPPPALMRAGEGEPCAPTAVPPGTATREQRAQAGGQGKGGQSLGAELLGTGEPSPVPRYGRPGQTTPWGHVGPDHSDMSWALQA